METLRTLTIALLVVAAFGAVTAAAANKKKIKSSVSARYVDPGSDPYAEGALFRGTVESKRDRCVAYRKVVAKSKPSGEKIGSSFSAKNGKFQINASGITKGRYKITAKKKTRVENGANQRVCKPATATVKVNG